MCHSALFIPCQPRGLGLPPPLHLAGHSQDHNPDLSSPRTAPPLESSIQFRSVTICVTGPVSVTQDLSGKNQATVPDLMERICYEEDG